MISEENNDKNTRKRLNNHLGKTTHLMKSKKRCYDIQAEEKNISAFSEMQRYIC